MTATAAFLREARRYDAPMIALVKVSLTDPSTKTLYLASNFIETPDFQYWEGAITRLDPIRAPGSFLSPGPDPCSFSFAVSARHALGFQTGINDNLSDLFRLYRWRGAAMVAYLWNQRLTAWSDAFLAFSGLIQNFTVASDECEVRCATRLDWNREVTPVRVTREKYPRAPEQSIGLPLPTVLGKIKSFPGRNPWPEDYGPVSNGISPVHDMEHVLGGRMSIPAVCIDTGFGLNRRARYQITNHKVKSHNDTAKATTYFLNGPKTLVPIDVGSFTVDGCTTNGTTMLATSNSFHAMGVKKGMAFTGTDIAAGTIVTAIASATSLTMSIAATGSHGGLTMTFATAYNDVDGAGFELPDNWALALYPIAPVAVYESTVAPGDDLRHAMDAQEVTAAHLIYQPSGPLIDKRRGWWRLPDIAAPGDFEGRMTLHFLYKSSSSLTNFRIGLRKAGVTAYPSGTVPASTTPARYGAVIGNTGDDWGASPLPTEPWAMSESLLVAEWETVPGARQDVWIYLIGAAVVYRPSTEYFLNRVITLSKPASWKRYIGTYETFLADVAASTADLGPPTSTTGRGTWDERAAWVDSLASGPFSGSIEGMEDDGSGTYTGTAAALIERPSDVARWILAKLGLDTLVELNTEGFLITNPSFEAGTAGWSPSAGLTATRNSNGGTAYGKYSVTAAFDASATARGWRFNLSGLTNQTYTVSMWYKSTQAAAASCQLLFVWDLAAGGQSTAQVSLENTGGIWKRAVKTFAISGINAGGTGYVDAPRAPTSIGPVTFEVDAVQLEAGSEATPFGVVGSFLDARALMKTWRGGDWLLAVQIQQSSDVMDLLQGVARAALSWCYLSREGKWQWVPWLKGGGVHAARQVWRDDLIEFQIEATPGAAVPSGIAVKYGFDASTGQYAGTIEVTGSTSRSGYGFLNLRDETLKIVNDLNDRIDFSTSGTGPYTADIAAADYATVHALCKAIYTAMLAADAGHVTNPVTPLVIESGYNDKLDFNDGANKTADLAASGTVTFADMAAVATAVAAAMNAVSTNWTCVYSQTTRKFTIDRTSGTKTLLLATGANRSVTTYTQLGYGSEQGDITAGVAGAFAVEPERVIIEHMNGSLDLLWASGTYGTQAAAPKGAHEVCGFYGAYDREGLGTRRWWMSDTPKGFRERTLADGATAFGQTRPITIESKAIYESDTARELRNRMVDWMSQAPIVIRLKTTRMPDLKRGELIQLADLDNFGLKFPRGDGLWAGRKFRVLQVVQRMGPTFEQEIEAIENF